MAIEEQILAFLQTPGLSDQQIAAELQRIGATAQQVSNVTGVPVDQVQSRIAAVPIEQGLFNFLQAPGLTDAQIAAEAQRLGATPQQISNVTGVPIADAQNRLFTEFLRTPGLTDGQIAAEMARLGVSRQQASTITGVPVRDVTNRFNTSLPFANAGVPSNMGTYTPPPAGSRTPATFAENFNNYVSIPLGAQYNPNVTAGGASPYSQIRPQMQPVGNPYAGSVGGQFMGGYDPTIYDPNLLNNFVRQRAAELAAAGMPVPAGFDGGGDGPGGAGDGAGSAAGDGGPGGAADGGSGPGDGPGTGAGYFMGGLIDRVSGSNPAGPDDGQISVQKGEYVVKKSSVNKYGKGLLDQINDGKIPAKKMKSLLG